MTEIDKRYKFRLGRLFFRNQRSEVIGCETMVPVLPLELISHDGNLIQRSCRDIGRSASENLVKGATGHPEVVRVTYTGPEFESNLTVREWASETRFYVREKAAFDAVVRSMERKRADVPVPPSTGQAVPEKGATEWKTILSSEMAKPQAKLYFERVKREREQGLAVFPEARDMFGAFRLTPFEKVKAVIIGQDPYPTRGHAHGLAFSCLSGVPASLRNVYTEICLEYHGTRDWKYYFGNGDLTHWATQGVLLLNTVLSVREGVPGSHADSGCEDFIRSLLLRLTAKRENIVFMLWGSKAKAFSPYITGNQAILQAAHPSPMSAEKGGWFGNGHFRACNDHLEKNGIEPIGWIPPAAPDDLDDF